MDEYKQHYAETTNCLVMWFSYQSFTPVATTYILRKKLRTFREKKTTYILHESCSASFFLACKVIPLSGLLCSAKNFVSSHVRLWQGFTSRFHCCVLSYFSLVFVMDHSGKIFVSSHPRLWKGVTHCWQTLPFQVQEPLILQACSIWNCLAANGSIPFLNCTFGCTAILDILYLVILH